VIIKQASHSSIQETILNVVCVKL